MNKIALSAIFSVIILLSSSLFITAYAVDNNCLINPIHILQVRIALACIEDRLDVLENAGGGSESTTASNLGTVGEGVFASEVGDDLQFKKLVGAGGTTITSNSTRILINSTGGSDTTVCSNVGTGNGLHKAGTNCSAFSLISGDGITITNTTDDWTFASVCENTGTGQAVCEANNNINSLIASTGVSIVDTTDDLTISLDPAYHFVYQVVGQTFLSATKTNIGTTYIDIYTAAFDEENLMVVNCDNISQFGIVFLWDYVGVGTQDVRWVDVSNNANVLFEDTNVVDSDPVSVFDIAKPAWCTGNKTIEMQGRSSTGTDDPIAKGYKILVR